MESVNFLNLEYILLRVYRFFADADASVGGTVNAIPEWISSLVQFVIIFGMVSSLVLLVLIVYAQIRLLQVEHAGFHAMGEHDHAAQGGGEETVVDQGDERWNRVMELASGANESEWRRAILEADIMLGEILMERGYPGATVGEQLKHANPLQMTTLDLAWKAHKVRNDVAHGGEGYHLSERDTRAAVDYYRRVFEEFGVI